MYELNTINIKKSPHLLLFRQRNGFSERLSEVWFAISVFGCSCRHLRNFLFCSLSASLTVRKPVPLWSVSLKMFGGADKIVRRTRDWNIWFLFVLYILMITIISNYGIEPYDHISLSKILYIFSLVLVFIFEDLFNRRRRSLGVGLVLRFFRVNEELM